MAERLGVQQNVYLPTEGATPLAVPAELLPRLTPDQVTQVLQIAHSERANAHELELARVNAKAKADSGGRLLAGIALVGILGAAGFAAYQGQFDWTLKILTPVGTAILGFIGGRGYEKTKKSE